MEIKKYICLSGWKVIDRFVNAKLISGISCLVAVGRILPSFQPTIEGKTLNLANF